MRGKNVEMYQNKKILYSDLLSKDDFSAGHYYQDDFRGQYFKKYIFAVLKLRYSEKEMDKLVLKHLNYESTTEVIVGPFRWREKNIHYIDMVGMDLNKNFRKTNSVKYPNVISDVLKVVIDADFICKKYIFNTSF